ncbi:Fip1 motif-domain-containing protein [Chytridium lagenaria]|nr:Fip1 motif-domain-containing protein [Chytridium lagenaria]
MDDDDIYGAEANQAENQEVEAEGNDEEEGSDESDDEIEIVLDSHEKPAEEAKPAGLVSIKPQQQIAKAGKEEDAAAPAPSKSNVDINGVGQYEGKDIYDADLDSFEDKPWRKPGADITDYFNYGFTEAVWKSYITKQKQLREEQMMQKRIHVYEFNKNEGVGFHDGFGQGFDGDGMHQGKYQRMQQQHQQQRNHRDMNTFGKRMRDQDDSVIQVLSNDFNGRDNFSQESDMRFQGQDDFHQQQQHVQMPPFGNPDFGHMPPQTFPPDMGGPVPFEMFRRGGPPPPQLQAMQQMKGRGMMRPPPQRGGDRPFFNQPSDAAKVIQPTFIDTREYSEARSNSRGGDERYDRRQHESAASPPNVPPSDQQYNQGGSGQRGFRERGDDRYYDDKRSEDDRRDRRDSRDSRETRDSRDSRRRGHDEKRR